MNIIFDLDGTLIDSSTGILSAIAMAFDKCGVVLNEPLTDKLIGPPLNKLLPLLANSNDEAVIEPLAEAFKENYDSLGYKETIVFKGIEEMLEQLKKNGHTLYLATNKRIIPTIKIIDYFSWGHLFDKLYALDQLASTLTKTDLIAHVLTDNDLDKNNTLYIGDTVADGDATKANNLVYIMAMWGYDSVDVIEGNRVDRPDKLSDYIEQIIRTLNK